MTGWAGALSEILVDSGPLIAGLDDTDIWHDECSRLMKALPGPLLVPATLVAKICCGLDRSILVDLPGSRYHIEEWFQQAKNEAGLEHHQLRSFRVWHAHLSRSPSSSR